jgi:hypothetical protein
MQWISKKYELNVYLQIILDLTENSLWRAMNPPLASMAKISGPFSENYLH